MMLKEEGGSSVCLSVKTSVPWFSDFLLDRLQIFHRSTMFPCAGHFHDDTLERIYDFQFMYIRWFLVVY